MSDLVEDFYGVYLLYNLSDKYKGRVYIGFTVDPNRRINQHNKGVRSGGARKTSSKGPWDMVLIVHGFPNEISALRFEWAWQNPKKSRRLKHLITKKGREKVYDYTLRVLAEMLRTGPWKRLPLTIRWLNENYAKEFPANLAPPFHMPIVYGSVISKKLPAGDEVDNPVDNTSNEKMYCYKCYLSIKKENLATCVNPRCDLKCHVLCLSKYFCTDSEDIIPIEGDCPSCFTHLLWGDVVRKKRGCYKDLDQNDADLDIFDYLIPDPYVHHFKRLNTSILS